MIKKIFQAILFMIVVSNCATTLPPHSQTDEEITQADRVIIKVENITFQEVGQYLVEQGFSINYSDENIGAIQTDYKKIDNSSAYQMKVSVLVKENEIHFYGSYFLSTLGGAEIENKGNSNRPVQRAWYNLKKLASGIPHHRVMFSRS